MGMRATSCSSRQAPSRRRHASWAQAQNESTKQGLRALRLAIVALALAQMACRPVVTVGWWEVAIILVLVAIVVLPVLLRFFRWYDARRGRANRANRKK
jgi:fatty acid desaturase